VAHINPDMRWYTHISSQSGVPPRCQFATVEACPRFYQSLSLLGKAGSTAIPPEEDARLKVRWEASDLWPRTDEQATTIAGDSKDYRSFWRFCPEVAYERFGYFASDLARYSDEIDVEVAHARLGAQGIPGSDWRWAWSAVHPMHFTECPLFSVLVGRAQPGIPPEPTETDVDRVARALGRLRSHPLVWPLVLVGVVVIAIAAFTDAAGQIVSLIRSALALSGAITSQP